MITLFFLFNFSLPWSKAAGLRALIMEIELLSC